MSISRDRGIYEWIQREEKAGNIYQEADGYYVWSPAKTPSVTGGFLDEYCLTEMVKYLHAKNAAWDWQVQHDPTIGP